MNKSSFELTEAFLKSGYKLIANIRTRLRNKRQLVIIEFKDNEVVFISPNQIKQNTTLEVNEIELLIGSSMRMDFYEKGEEMFNGKICDKENLVLKEYFFHLEKPVDKLRAENKERLLPYEKIVKIFRFFKFNRENAGIETESGRIIYMPQKRLDTQSKLDKSEQHILVGSYIMPEYFQPGETFMDGTIVQKTTVLKCLNLRFSDNIDGMHESFESDVSSNYGTNYGTSFVKYGGYNGYSDDAIDDAFEGDPSNTWNVD